MEGPSASFWFCPRSGNLQSVFNVRGDSLQGSAGKEKTHFMLNNPGKWSLTNLPSDFSVWCVVLWYPACRLPCFQKLGSKKDPKPSSAIFWGMSGADLQNCGFVDISVTSNGITAKSRLYVAKQECVFILGGYCTRVHTTKHLYGALPCRGCTHH